MGSIGFKLLMGVTILVIGAVSGRAASDLADAPQLEVSVNVSQTRMNTAETIQFTVEARVPTGWKVAMTEIGPKMGAWSVLDSSLKGPELDGEAILYTLRLRLSPYLEGRYEIPSLRVEGVSLLDPDHQPVVVNTEPLSVEVVSVFEGKLIPTRFHGVITELNDPGEPSLEREIGLGLLLLFIVFSSTVLGQESGRAGVSDEREASDLALQALFKLRNVSAEGGDCDYLREANDVIHSFFEAHYEIESAPRVSLDTVDRLIALVPGDRRSDVPSLQAFFERYDQVRFARPADKMRVLDDVYRAFDDLLTALDAQPGWTEDA